MVPNYFFSFFGPDHGHLVIPRNLYYSTTLADLSKHACSCSLVICHNHGLSINKGHDKKDWYANNEFQFENIYLKFNLSQVSVLQKNICCNTDTGFEPLKRRNAETQVLDFWNQQANQTKIAKIKTEPIVTRRFNFILEITHFYHKIRICTWMSQCVPKKYSHV